MTLVELMLCLVVTAAVMGALSLVSGSLRNQSADERTRRVLQVLRRAMLRYHDAHADWPQPPTPNALRTLFDDPATAPLLESLSPARSEQGFAVLDGYNQPVRYRPPDAQATEPDFVSAGEDGRFGDSRSNDPNERSAAVDNLYGAETEDASP